MDGNRRWATSNQLQKISGHSHGLNKLT
jgi:ditrans,polycis-polyprenyl diphosphate synthase